MTRRPRMRGTINTGGKQNGEQDTRQNTRQDAPRDDQQVTRDMHQLDESAARATLGAYIGLAAGAALVHLVLNEYGAGLPRWARFVALVGGSAGGACLLASVADSVRALIGRLLVIVLVLLAGTLILSVA